MSASASPTMLSAIILTKDISDDSITVYQSDKLTLQHFSYQCSRKRTASGIPYGPTVPSYLDFTVRVTEKEQGKAFYERAGLGQPFRYSFLFDAVFEDEELKSYKDAMVVTGYIIESEDFFDQPEITGYDENDKPVYFSDEQQLLRCRLLLCGIEYMGKTTSLKLTITED